NLHRAARLSMLILRAALAGACLTGEVGCFAPRRMPGVVVYASGTDLESGNPLVTTHPLSRQIQRFALFVTLARYDSALAPVPYFARRWAWSADRRTLTLHLVSDLRWHDGVATTARDVAFTIDAARDPATGYWRAGDLADVDRVDSIDDTTTAIHFRTAQTAFPAILCELPIAPFHLLGAVPRRELQRASYNLHPVGNGPFAFVERRAGSRWVFKRNAEFPASLGGPPRLSGIVVTVVDEPTTKFAGLASGDLDVAGLSLSTARDTALADSLLDAAGWRRGPDGARRRGGRTFAVGLLTVGSGDNALEQLIQADLAARGIHVAIR